MDNKNPYKNIVDEIDSINHIEGLQLPTAPPSHITQNNMQQPMPITNQPVVTAAYRPLISSPAVGPDSTELNCPQCQCRIKTKVRHRATAKTHIACLLLSCTGCCCCLPYFMDSCRNANHFCPMCGTFIGTYQS